MRIQHTCTACGSDFTIAYDEMQTESEPTHCPFCGEYLLLEDDDFSDESLHDDEDEEPL